MALAISETGLHELERSFDAVARTVLAEGNSSADQEGIAMKIEEMKNLFMRRVKNELKVEGTDRKDLAAELENALKESKMETRKLQDELVTARTRIPAALEPVMSSALEEVVMETDTTASAQEMEEPISKAIPAEDLKNMPTTAQLEEVAGMFAAAIDGARSLGSSVPKVVEEMRIAKSVMEQQIVEAEQR
uniref:Uncharacterized protein n=2 Tax=Rhodosorus marinus TaxID=101924 RepID=A0A7S2ZLV2_9RHOD|mmetsp:Transcript_23776/g.93563  ORF Transcript_23776/g.93563 Transcript_23776/m.93563 type:complete len:191 (+) Transcript_23776:85-657(+)|eukprot:CAMPEP_0113965816 /NCGR_PEP_ID=MMETSP0011_2-20120614/7967_1 /TAXON_ID=101924 /ORGANISM="Rhodosorus marinus" /LENGTH=190 /DNA_ID=CAMNT_0000978395 /DNA_START=24 /DNA_END=596 /DNA_ORIENTATION=- /assembly_acc=CAM_ASM_000156